MHGKVLVRSLKVTVMLCEDILPVVSIVAEGLMRLQLHLHGGGRTGLAGESDAQTRGQGHPHARADGHEQTQAAHKRTRRRHEARTLQ